MASLLLLTKIQMYIKAVTYIQRCNDDSNDVKDDVILMTMNN